MPDSVETCALVDRAVAGDRVALERLLLDHCAALVQRVESRLPRSMQSVLGAEDIVQQTYAQVFARIACYERRDGATFLAWLLAIAENRLRDAIRAENRQKRGGSHDHVRDVPDEMESRAANLFDRIAGSAHTPSGSVARREGIHAIQVAVAALPDEYRQAVALRYFEGYSLEETARRMGRSTGAVRGLLDRAKKRMRDALVRASRYLSSK